MNCLLHNISISMLYLLSVIILMFVSKCLYSHEMHADVFRHKVPLCLQVTFKWLNEIDRKQWTQMCNMLTTADEEYMVIIDLYLQLFCGFGNFWMQKWGKLINTNRIIWIPWHIFLFVSCCSLISAL